MNPEKKRLQELAGIQNKKFYVLVGPPSVGKSTWIKNNLGHLIPYIVSRDEVVEQVAESFGFGYDELFLSPPEGSIIGDKNEKFGEVVSTPKEFKNFYGPLSYSNILVANEAANKRFAHRIYSAAGKDIVVIDMTNMSSDSRRGNFRAIKGLEDEYEKIAVVFKFKGHEDLIQKIATKRAEISAREGKPKTISPASFERMFNSYQDIKPSEKFDKIIYVDTVSDLQKFLN